MRRPAILSLSSSFSPCSLFFEKNGQVFDRVADAHPSVALVALLDDFCTQFSAFDVDCVALDIGPGSFTATRLAMSLGLGVACARDLSVVPVLSTEAFAMHAFREAGASLIAVAVELRRDAIFLETYQVLPDSFHTQSSALLLTSSEWCRWVCDYRHSFDLLCGSLLSCDTPDFFNFSYTARDVYHVSSLRSDDPNHCRSPENVRASYVLQPSALTLAEQRALLLSRSR